MGSNFIFEALNPSTRCLFQRNGSSLFIASLLWCLVALRSGHFQVWLTFILIDHSVTLACHPCICYVSPLIYSSFSFVIHLYVFAIMQGLALRNPAAALTMFLSQSRSLSHVTILCCYLTISLTTSFLSRTCYFLICSPGLT